MLRTKGAWMLVFSFLIVMPHVAYAQVNPEIANCDEIKDEDTKLQADLCSAHIGCAFVLKIQAACAKAKGFLDKLKNTLTGRKSISNEDVFDAYSPELAPSEALKRNVAKARDASKGASQREDFGRKAEPISNIPAYYEGAYKDGIRNGPGIVINERGVISRGNWENGVGNGAVQTILPNGTMFAGEVKQGRPTGNMSFQDAKGNATTGTMSADFKFSGNTEVVAKDGATWMVPYDTAGNPISSKTVVIRAPPTPPTAVAAKPATPVQGAGTEAKAPVAPATASTTSQVTSSSNVSGSPTASTGQPTSASLPPGIATDTWVMVTLYNRIDKDRPSKIKVPIAEYEASKILVDACKRQYTKGCEITAYKYNTQHVALPYRLKTVVRAYPVKRTVEVPECPYRPTTYGEKDTSTQTAEEICRNLLNMDIHETMDFNVRFAYTGGKLLSEMTIPLKLTGHCKNDIKAFEESGVARFAHWRWRSERSHKSGA